jgi:outer membrane protein
LVGLVGLAPPAQAQDALGEFVVRVRLDGVVPQDSSSVVTKLGGRWQSTSSAGPDVDISWFLTPHFALGLGVSTSHHAFTLQGSTSGVVPVGSARLIVPTLTFQYHVMSDGWFRPYLGIGPTGAILTNPRPGGTLVDQLYFSNKAGVAFQAGVDLYVHGSFVVNLDIKQLLVTTVAYSPHPPRTPVQAKVNLDPTIFGVGLGYRF